MKDYITAMNFYKLIKYHIVNEKETNIRNSF